MRRLRRLRNRKYLRVKKMLLAIACVCIVLAVVVSTAGTFLLNAMWSAIGSMVWNISLPVAASYSDAEHLKDEGIARQIMDEMYPAGLVYQMSYNNTLGCETNYSINVSGNNIEVVNSETSAAQVDNAGGSLQEKPSQNEATGNVISRNVITGSTYQAEQLYNYAFTKRFYTVTSITSLTSDILRPKEFLGKDMTVSHGSETPQILIFHTHSQEGFTDSVEGDDSTTILGVGDYLTKLLTEQYGYNVIHDRSIYDYVDGKLDRSKAYTYSENGIAAILKDIPSIDVVIDLHRDGVAQDTRLVTQVDGKQMAKVMFFNGISYSNAVGNIGYLNNPYRDDNLAMSLQMHLLGEAYYPGYLRNIYVNAYRYCLHERGKSMLIEAGAQTNTFDEVKNAMEPLADLLDKLLRGEKAY